MKIQLRRLSDYEPLTNAILKFVAKKIFFTSDVSLDSVLADHPRLIVVFNHSSPLSWVPAPCLLTAQLAARGGGARTPIAVMDRFFYSVPGLRKVAQFITQSEVPLRFEDLVERYQTLGTADLVVFPEGSNCFFGDPNVLQPFRSDRFVEIAMRTRTPLLLCVHRGSEEWGKNIPMNEDIAATISELPLPTFARKFLGDRIKSGFTVPLLPKPMAQFSMYAKVYSPRFSEADENQSVEWRSLVSSEALRVHEEMRSMLNHLDGLIAKASTESRI